MMANEVVETHNQSKVESGSIRWLYYTKSGCQVQKVTVTTEKSIFRTSADPIFYFPGFFNVPSQPQRRPEVQKVFQSKVTPFGKWPPQNGEKIAPRPAFALELALFGSSDRGDRAWPGFLHFRSTIPEKTAHQNAHQQAVGGATPVCSGKEPTTDRQCRTQPHWWSLEGHHGVSGLPDAP